MLRLIVSGEEKFNNETNEFIYPEETILEFEHSLVSLSKWESKYQVPFLGPEDKTPEQIKGYLDAMLISGELTEEVYQSFSMNHLQQINDYISSTESATTFSDTAKGRGRPEVITSELIYYWLVTFQIPFEVEHWHLNRLFALIKICNIKNSKEKKMSRTEQAARNRTLNAQRKANLGTSG